MSRGGRKPKVTVTNPAPYTAYCLGDKAAGIQMGGNRLVGTVSYIHPSGYFINIRGEHYTESFSPEMVERRSQ